MARLAHEPMIPVPAVAVHRIMRKPVEVLDAPEVGNQQDGVVGVLLGAAPDAERDDAELVAAVLQRVRHGLEEGADLARAGREEA